MSSRLGARIGYAMVLLLSVLVGLSAISGWDIWWHLKAGELAVSRLSTLPIDEFSLTQQGDPWVYKDLGAEILLYFLYDGMGEAGLALFRVLVAATLLLLLLLLVRRHVQEPTLAVLVTGIAFLIVAFRVTVRPEAFSLLLFPTFLLMVSRHRRSRSGFGQGHWPLAVLVVGQWLWANLHRGSLLGLVLLWGYALVTWITLGIARWTPRSGQAEPQAAAVVDRSGHRAWLIAGCALLATAATAINPSGLAIFTQSFAVVTSDTMGQLVSEWQNVNLVQMCRLFPTATAWMILTAISMGLMIGFSRIRRQHLWEIGLAVLFLAWGFKAVRMLPYMAMATTPWLALSLDRLVGSRAVKWSTRAPALPILAGASLLALGAAVGSLALPRPGWAIHRYPQGAVDLILNEPVLGEGFVTFTFAGYVIFHAWPEKHVICDGRFDTVYSQQTMMTCMAAERDPRVFEELRRRYSLQWVLAHNRPASSRQVDHPRAFEYLDRDPDWALIDWDESALLYVRRQGPNAELARERGYRFLRPHDPDVSLLEALEATRQNPALFPDLESEVRRLYRDAGDDYRAAIVLALFLDQTGRQGSEPYDVVLEQLRAFRDRDPEAIDQVLDFVQR